MWMKSNNNTGRGSIPGPPTAFHPGCEKCSLSSAEGSSLQDGRRFLRRETGALQSPFRQCCCVRSH